MSNFLKFGLRFEGSRCMEIRPNQKESFNARESLKLLQSSVEKILILNPIAGFAQWWLRARTNAASADKGLDRPGVGSDYAGRLLARHSSRVPRLRRPGICRRESTRTGGFNMARS